MRSFLHANAALYGLSAAQIDGLAFLGESVSPKSGVRMVRVEQRIQGVPVFQSETRFILDRDGRVWRSLGLLVPDGAVAAAAVPALSAAQALTRAMGSVGIVLDPAAVSVQTDAAGKTRVRVGDQRIGGDVASDLVYFPPAPGLLVPALAAGHLHHRRPRLVRHRRRRAGALLWRKDIRAYASAQDARFSVYVQADGTTPADSPAPQSPTTVTPGSGTQFPAIAPHHRQHAHGAGPRPPARTAGSLPDGAAPTRPDAATTSTPAWTLDGAATTSATPALLDGNGRPMGNPDVNGRNRDFLGTTPRDLQLHCRRRMGGNPDAGQTAPGTGAGPASRPPRPSPSSSTSPTGTTTSSTSSASTRRPATSRPPTSAAWAWAATACSPTPQDGSGTNNANFSTPPDGTSGPHADVPSSPARPSTATAISTPRS